MKSNPLRLRELKEKMGIKDKKDKKKDKHDDEGKKEKKDKDKKKDKHDEDEDEKHDKKKDKHGDDEKKDKKQETKRYEMDTLGIEPSTPRMLSGCDNQLHHVPVQTSLTCLPKYIRDGRRRHTRTPFRRVSCEVGG